MEHLCLRRYSCESCNKDVCCDNVTMCLRCDKKYRPNTCAQLYRCCMCNVTHCSQCSVRCDGCDQFICDRCYSTDYCYRCYHQLCNALTAVGSPFVHQSLFKSLQNVLEDGLFWYDEEKLTTVIQHIECPHLWARLMTDGGIKMDSCLFSLACSRGGNSFATVFQACQKLQSVHWILSDLQPMWLCCVGDADGTFVLDMLVKQFGARQILLLPRGSNNNTIGHIAAAYRHARLWSWLFKTLSNHKMLELLSTFNSDNQLPEDIAFAREKWKGEPMCQESQRVGTGSWIQHQREKLAADSMTRFFYAKKHWKNKVVVTIGEV